MADNVAITPGVGATVAADDIGGALFQRVKLIHGADGTNDGDVSNANPLPIDDAGGSITVDGTVTANLSDTDNAVLDTIDAVLDTIKTDTAALVTDAAASEVLLGTIDADTSAIATDIAALEVDLAAIEVLQTTIAGDTTSIDAKTPALGQALAAASVPVVLTEAQITTLTPLATVTANLGATDNAVLDSIDSAVNGTLDVNIVSGAGSGGTASDDDADFTAGTTAGTPAMGVYEASPSSVTNGDIGIVGITQTRALRTAVEGTVTVDLGANNDVTVTGTVDLGATDNAVLDSIKSDTAALVVDAATSETLLSTIDADTSAMVTDLAAIEVLLGTIDADTGAIATDAAAIETLLTGIDADTDAIKTAVQLIDNTVGAIAGPGSPVIDSYTHAAINLAAGANQVLVSSAASKQIWVYGLGFTVNATAGTISFQDEDDTAVSGIMHMDAKSGMAISPSGNFAMPIWKLGTDKDLEVDIVSTEMDGWIDYAIVSV